MVTQRTVVKRRDCILLLSIISMAALKSLCEPLHALNLFTTCDVMFDIF